MAMYKESNDPLSVLFIGGIVGVIFVLVVLGIYYFSPSSRNSPTNPVKTTALSDDTLRQIAELGKPEVTAFHPDEEFTLINDSVDETIISSIGLPLGTTSVKRTGDNAVFQVSVSAYAFGGTLIPGTKVKLFKISWKENLSANGTPAGFKPALPLERAAKYSQSLSKGPK